MASLQTRAMNLQILLDPWRGGFEICDDDGPLLLCDGTGHGGSRLVGITDHRQLPAGVLPLPFRSDLTADCVAIESDGVDLRITCAGLRLQLRVGWAARVVTVVHEDFN